MDSKRPKGGIPMTATVRKWGNSLAIRIPSHVAEQLSIKEGSEMKMIVEDQEIKLVPKKRKKKKPTLKELLAQITPENRHEEIDFGIKGRELI